MSTVQDHHMISLTPDANSPDGSAEIGNLLSSPQGDLTHAVCPAGAVSSVHELPELYEAYYILAVRGEIWRQTADREGVTTLRPGRWVEMQCHVAKVDLAVCTGHRRGVTCVTGGTGVISGRGCCCVAESGSGDSRDAGRLGSAGRGGRRDRRLRGAGTAVGRQAARARDHVPDVGVGVVPR